MVPAACLALLLAVLPAPPCFLLLAVMLPYASLFLLYSLRLMPPFPCCTHCVECISSVQFLLDTEALLWLGPGPFSAPVDAAALPGYRCPAAAAACW